MEEKILIKAKFSSMNFLFIFPGVLFIIGLGIVVDSREDDIIAPFILGSAFLFLITWAIKSILEKREIIVTNKRVIARGAFGHRVDLPIEKITNISMYWFNGIGVGSPSVKIRAHFCVNKNDVFDTIASETVQRDSKYR